MESIEKYALAMSEAEDELLRELDRETHLRAMHPRMLSGHMQGMLLKMLTQMLRPRRALEIGTFTGYATLCIAAGLGDGATIDTIEVDDELESLAASFFTRSPHRDKIRPHIGSALDIVPALLAPGEAFDLIFIDGDKREYPDYYRMAMDVGLVRQGSIILADNTLWSGKVVQPVAHGDIHTQKILEFNAMVRADDRVESLLLPMRDGLSVIRVK
ncbi:MAG: O-methyltransferase [Rikenellaceae bacterium]|nr:O-methyltransferase [Rikenellaceae bacterium]MCL2692398.1 O-methyltransferase [Rikenellaceae bacterium]